MPNSARALRKTYGRLHAEDHINNEAAILIRAGEKLAAENKILRKKNEDLRDTIFEEKRKRKRDKSLNFYEEDEQKDQTLFFNSAKVIRARERAAALEKIELQQKRTATDKKLQQAIAREKKTREATKKKIRKKAERTAAREEITREKAVKAAEKEIKKT
jgi:hypothetical protein